jgi:putative hydrolase of the HAD superfamily
VSAPAFASGVRGIAFDAGNTLLWIDHARVAAIVTGAGHPVTTAAVREAEIRARPLLDPFLGKAPKRESEGVYRRHIGFILRNLGVTDEAVVGRAADAIAEVWAELWCVPPADAHDTLRALRERGYRVSCLSNSNGRVDRLLEAAELMTLLDDVVDSGAVGVEKPDPRIFTMAAERMGLRADEVVYVGDLHSIDVLGARGAGMHAVLLDPIDAWEGFDAPKVRALDDLLTWFPGPAAA